MFVEIHVGFNKGIGLGGTSTLKIKAFARISIYGKKVTVINESANSKKTAMMVGGIPVMNPKKLFPMRESVLDQLMIDLDKRIKKITKNATKKI